MQALPSQVRVSRVRACENPAVGRFSIDHDHPILFSARASAAETSAIKETEERCRTFVGVYTAREEAGVLARARSRVR